MLWGQPHHKECVTPVPDLSRVRAWAAGARLGRGLRSHCTQHFPGPEDKMQRQALAWGPGHTPFPQQVVQAAPCQSSSKWGAEGALLLPRSGLDGPNCLWASVFPRLC